ncbi:MAG: glycoside hydrolase family 27 protein [Sphingomonas adhaesiva]|uniref:glycoside hydrolase family 27 protein n=1 Tax=Sphingomonas adhaesiva TaxID=28212 RepID=UPI002FF6A295
MIRRAWAALCLLLFALPAAAAPPARTGSWVFDGAPSYPGVTMMRVERDGAGVRGEITTRWYGPIAMQNPRLRGDTLTFDTRNLNDNAHPTRRWTARFTPRGVRLTGDMWYAHVVQDGRRGTPAEVAARTFRPAPPLPALGSLPDDGLARTPPMGWSSWNRFAEKIDDATVRAMADAMVSSGLRDAGYVYVNIDDGWQGTRGSDGELRPNAKFPDMKALADYVHARGLKLGIYSSPGPKTCAGYEGSYGHVEQDARTFARWGVDFLKYDLCSGEWFYADADSVKRTYYQMGAALRATGRPIVYSLCQYGRFDVADWGRSVGGHLWRTTGDITDDYKTMSDIGFVRNPQFPHAGPGGWNDPDMLEVGNGGMSADEYRTHFTLWAIQAAPLLMGHDLRLTGASDAAILENGGAIAIDQDSLGVQGRRETSVDGIETWRKPLAGGDVAIAIFNRTTADRDADVPPGLAAQGGRIIDVWRGRALAADETRLRVPAHGTVLLRVVAPGTTDQEGAKR